MAAATTSTPQKLRKRVTRPRARPAAPMQKQTAGKAMNSDQASLVEKNEKPIASGVSS
jgi:hypothetical protein